MTGGQPPRIVPSSPEWLALRRRLAETRVPCRELPGFLWTSDDLDDRILAAVLCEDCAIVAECRSYAETAKERDHVWGGQDFTKQYRNRA